LGFGDIRALGEDWIIGLSVQRTVSPIPARQTALVHSYWGGGIFMKRKIGILASAMIVSLLAMSLNALGWSGEEEIWSGENHTFTFHCSENDVIEWEWYIVDPDTSIFPDVLDFFIQNPNGEKVYDIHIDARDQVNDKGSLTATVEGDYTVVWANRNWVDRITINYDVTRKSAGLFGLSEETICLLTIGLIALVIVMVAVAVILKRK
jgi:hypothetical protein